MWNIRPGEIFQELIKSREFIEKCSKKTRIDDNLRRNKNNSAMRYDLARFKGDVVPVRRKVTRAAANR